MQTTYQSFFAVNQFSLIAEASLNFLGDVLTRKTKLINAPFQILLLLVQHLRFLRPANSQNRKLKRQSHT